MSAGNTKVNQPGTPTIGTASDNNTGGGATVAFTAGTGSATSFTAISTPGSFTASAASSPITVTGMSIGSSYTFKVFASNTFGQSQQSAASNSVTIVAPITSFGYISLGTSTSVINKLNMVTETNASTTGFPTTTTASNANGGQNTAVAGYTTLNNASSTAYKQSFVNDSVSTLASPTTQAVKTGVGGMNNTNISWYIAGGANSNQCCKMPFSTETFANISSTMTSMRENAGSGNNGTTAGYMLGGRSNSSGVYHSNGDKLTYSSDTFSTIGAPAVRRTLLQGGLVNAGVSLIILGGYIDAPTFNRTNTIRKMLFSNETTSSQPSAVLPAAAGTVANVSGSTNGYSFPGDTNAGNFIQRYVFSNDTNSTIAATLTAASQTPAGTYANTP